MLNPGIYELPNCIISETLVIDNKLKPVSHYTIVLSANETSDIQAGLNDINSSLNVSDKVYFNRNVYRPDGSYTYSFINTSQAKIVPMGISVLIAAFFCLYSSYAAFDKKNRHQFAVLKLIGFTGINIVFYQTLQCIILLFIGIPFGLLIGILISCIMKCVFINVYQMSFEIIISAYSIVISCIFSILAILTICLIPAIRTSKIKPIQVINRTTKKVSVSDSSTRSKDPLINWGIKSVLSNPKKVISIVISLALSITLIIVGSYITKMVIHDAESAYAVSDYEVGLSDQISYTSLRIPIDSTKGLLGSDVNFI